MNAAIRRALGPLRPILGPPYRAMRSSVWPGPNDWARSTRAGRRNRKLATGVRGMSRSEFLELKRQFPYYKARGRYMSVASALVDELSARYGIGRALELGAHRRPIATGADVMDLALVPGLTGHGELIIANATEPWPFPAKSYDLFVALQVFEHLGTGQPDAFREAVRVARHAIISLPIDWTMADPTNCHHGITQDRALDWFAPLAPTRIVLGNGGRRRRVIFVFENLPDRLESPG